MLWSLTFKIRSSRKNQRSTGIRNGEQMPLAKTLTCFEQLLCQNNLNLCLLCTCIMNILIFGRIFFLVQVFFNKYSLQELKKINKKLLKWCFKFAFNCWLKKQPAAWVALKHVSASRQLPTESKVWLSIKKNQCLELLSCIWNISH